MIVEHADGMRELLRGLSDEHVREKVDDALQPDSDVVKITIKRNRYAGHGHPSWRKRRKPRKDKRG